MRTLIFISFFPSLLYSAGMKNIRIDNQFVNNVPKTFTMSAGYFRLENKSGQEIKFTEASSNCAKTVEMHDVIESNGVSKMVHMPSITISPNSKIHFKPRGKHLMLIGLTNEYHSGKACQFSLVSDKKHKISFTAAIKER